ncbi:MAG: hypothetical protein HC896_07230 [Bacteroidales bacterium]|nr:hypothetical protein [Bacteroidales bacterium]
MRDARFDTWQVLGPFKCNVNDPSQGFYTDHLAVFGIHQQHITANGFKQVAKEAKKNKDMFCKGEPVFTSYTMDEKKYLPTGTIFGFAEVNEGYQDYKNNNTYFANTLYSKQQKDTILAFGSNYGLMVWLNGKLVLEDPNPRVFNNDFIDYVPVTLNNGDNFILIKLNNRDYGSTVKCDLLSSEESLEQVHSNAIDKLLLKNNYLPGEQIGIKYSLHALTQGQVSWEIEDCAGNVILNGALTNREHLTRWPNNLHTGLYRLIVHCGKKKFSESFFVGSFDGHHHTLALLCKYAKPTDAVSLNGLLYRYGELLKSPTRYGNHFEQRKWERKLTLVLENIYGLVEPAYNGGSNSFSQILLRGYKSNVDNASQYYIMIKPSVTRANAQLPLLLVLRPLYPKNLHFMTGYPLADQYPVERMVAVADQYNVYVLIPWARIMTNEPVTPMVEDELFASIKEVSKYYLIDTNQIFIAGICHAGEKSLTVAAHYPGKFAGVVTYGSVYTNKPDNVWQEYTYPKTLVNNLKHVPILSIHSDTDPHTPIETFMPFADTAKKLGLNFMLDIVPESHFVYESNCTYQEAAHFMQQNQKSIAPHSFSYKTAFLKYNQVHWITLNRIRQPALANISATFYEQQNTVALTTENIVSLSIKANELPIDKSQVLQITNNGKTIYKQQPASNTITLSLIEEDAPNLIKTHDVEGPMQDVFASDFAIVYPTGQTSNAYQMHAALADSLIAEWDRYYFQPPRVVNDIR